MRQIWRFYIYLIQFYQWYMWLFLNVISAIIRYEFYDASLSWWECYCPGKDGGSVHKIQESWFSDEPSRNVKEFLILLVVLSLKVELAFLCLFLLFNSLVFEMGQINVYFILQSVVSCCFIGSADGSKKMASIWASPFLNLALWSPLTSVFWWPFVNS